MRYPIIILLLILISCEQPNKRMPIAKEKSERDYGGEVKRIIEYVCDKYRTNENPLKVVENSCKIYNIKDFNPDETLTKEMRWYNLDYPNDPRFIETVKINEFGLVIERIAKQVGNSGFETKTNYSYNDAGFITERIVYRDGAFFSREETEYDEFNCPIKKYYFNENNEIEHYYVNEFDNNNREISSSKYNSDNVLERKYVQQYEGDNIEWVVRHIYNSEGKLIAKNDERESYKTNKVDYLYTETLPDEGFTNIEYFSNGKVRRWHFINQNNDDVYQVYDENGRIIERKIYRDEEWLDTYTWKYREDGAVVEESESTSRVVGKSYYKKTTYFKVDFNGNWIEKYTIDSEGNVAELGIREIEYFD